jgi:flagellar biosynthesis component FlhA
VCVGVKRDLVHKKERPTKARKETTQKRPHKKETNERRKEEIQQVFADKPVGQTLGQPMGQTFGQPLQSEPLERIERLITKQTEMILSVLETQMKLIDYLQRNKK